MALFAAFAKQPDQDAANATKDGKPRPDYLIGSIAQAQQQQQGKKQNAETDRKKTFVSAFRLGIHCPNRSNQQFPQKSKNFSPLDN
jgi:hypothetical protein